MGTKSFFVNTIIKHHIYPNKVRTPVCWIWQRPSNEQWANDYMPMLQKGENLDNSLNETPNLYILDLHLIEQVNVHIEQEKSKENIQKVEAFDLELLLDEDVGDDSCTRREDGQVNGQSNDPMLDHLKEANKPI